jgi:DNA-binding NtrC family response regulator
MTMNADGAAATGHPTPSALVVEPHAPDALTTVEALSRSGFRVTLAETFARAKEHLASQIPDVLVTAIRLGEFNGLHLVLRATSARPDTSALVVSDYPDMVLEADAEAMGATFVLKPVSGKELTAAVFRTLAARGDRARGLAVPIRPPFERRVSQRRKTTAPVSMERRQGDRRRDLPTLLRFIAPAN